VSRVGSVLALGKSRNQSRSIELATGNFKGEVMAGFTNTLDMPA